LDPTILDDLIENAYQRVNDCRVLLLSGQYALPLDLGLSGPASHMDRGERDCFAQALHHIAQAVGPAARLIDGGYFAGSSLSTILAALERPKAGIVLTATPDMRQHERTLQANLTAQISVINHNACQADWPLEATAAGHTLVVMCGGAFGLLSREQAFNVLENASRALLTGDFFLVTLEQPRDVAVLEAAYLDYGNQIVTHALNQIGRSEGLSPRVFYDDARGCIRLGAVTPEGGMIAWNGTRCAFEPGTWLDVGAITLHDLAGAPDLHPDFEVEDKWTSADQVVSLVLLRKT
jgi:hypothetical protein